MSSKQIVIDYYENLVNKIDIIAEKWLTKETNDTKRDEINSTRSMFLDKIKEIQDLNLEYLKSNKIGDDEQTENVFKPKVCYPINQCFDDVLGRLVIARDLVNKPVLDLLNYRSTKDYESSKDFITSQIFRRVIEQHENELIIDISSEEKFKMEELNIDFDEDFELNDLEIIENMIDIDHLDTLIIGVEYEFIFKNDIFSKFSNLKTLKIFLLFDCTFESECFKCLTNLEELKISSSRRKAVLDQTILSPLTKLEKLELSAIECTNPIESGHLLNIKNLVISECELDFKASSVVNTNLKTLVSCQDAFFSLEDLDFFKSFKSLLYLNLSETLLINFRTECLNYLENLEYLNLYKTDKCANTKFVYSNLTLPKLKYLAIDSNQVPVFKHLQLEYLKIGGLKKFDSSKLTNQPELIGLSLVISQKMYNNFNANNFKELDNLVHLEIEIVNDRKVDKNKCVGFINDGNVSLKEHRYKSNAFMASIYEYYEEISEVMTFSDETLAYIFERFEIGHEF